MKALIFKGYVTQVTDKEFEVHDEWTWVNCDESVQQGYTFENGKFIPPAAAPERTYSEMRAKKYPSVGDQLDDLFKAGLFSEEMAAKIQAIKDKYSKG